MSLHTWSIGICSQIKTYNDQQMTETTEILPAFKANTGGKMQVQNLKSSPSVSPDTPSLSSFKP